ncbi:glycosyltransferase family 2 protein [Candidatus Microgenomates bacterium]|nr:MAG: glycosyltransferase family 2 protein [Candidatus Microgenomates bacterium]
MNKPLVSVIVVSWNGLKYLDDCLGSLTSSTYKNIEILFADNASSDDSVNFVKKNYPQIKLIQNKKNLGYAEGHEEAFKKAKGDAILLLSMDTIIKKNTLEELVKVLYSDNSIGAVQPKLLLFPETTLIDSVGAFFLDSGMLYHFGREKDYKLKKYNEPMEIFSAKGACLLFRKETLRKTGLFDKDYFAYFEETDLCHRVWLAGYKIIYNPKAVVYHKGGGSSGQMVRSYILFHSYKNRICTYIKNLSIKYLLKVIPLTLMLYMLVSLFYLLKGKFSLAWVVQKAIIWNILHIKETLKKRKVIQEKIRVVKDDDFLPKLTRPVRISYYYYLLFGLKNYID